MSHKVFSIIMVVLLAVLTACSTTTAQPIVVTATAQSEPSPIGVSDSPSTATPPVTAEATPAATTTALAEAPEVEVGAISVQILESFPVQAEAIVNGTLADACSFIEQVKQEREGTRFVLTFTAARHPNQRCMPQRTPFEEIVPLDVEGLPGGDYEIASHGFINTFTLPDGSAQGTNEIVGHVWHDLCAVGEGAQSSTPPAGCVAVGQSFQANGMMEAGEPGIAGVSVQLGFGGCPMSGLAEATTGEDGSFRFSNLSAGTYCVIVEPTTHGNEDILPPGMWTGPRGVKGAITVTFTGEDERQQANLGWDYQFLPEPDQSSSCLYRATFVDDVTVPDEAVLPAGEPFTKVWRIRNSGTCPLPADMALSWAEGHRLGAPTAPVPFGKGLPPGEMMEVSVSLVAPSLDGRYRAEWLMTRGGKSYGFGRDGKAALYVDFWVGERPVESGSITGWVWQDDCRILGGEGGVGTPSGGCVPDGSGSYKADGVPNNGERGIAGLTVSLRPGACPSSGATEANDKTDQWGEFEFNDLAPGSYCVFVDLGTHETDANLPILLPGAWTAPSAEFGGFTVELKAGEQKRLEFGWDYQLQ